MKRKRPPPHAADSVTPAKKQRSIQDKQLPCPFIKIFQQYGLLQSIVSSLRPSDLFALMLSNKTIYNAIFPRPESLENILGRLCCSGKGVEIRKKVHKKLPPIEGYVCTENVLCASETTDRNVLTKPCIRCKLNTCDECRIHCTYQSYCETSGESDELPYFSGFVLLEEAEVPILSPGHLNEEITAAVQPWKNPSIDQVAPYHDSGFLDVPFNDDATAPPEYIPDILDLTLGQNSLATYPTTSHIPYPSPVLRALCQVVEGRKIPTCHSCVRTQGSISTDSTDSPTVLEIGGLNPCRCTLRNRVLERWLCLRCFVKEEEVLANASQLLPNSTSDMCDCGNYADHVLCMWCMGEISDPNQRKRETDSFASDSPPPQIVERA